MSALRAMLLVGLGVFGVALAASALPRFRRPSLAARLAPYLGALGPGRSRLLEGPTQGGVGGVWRLLVDDLAARLTRVVGDGGRDLKERLDASGSGLSISVFRSQQVTWGLAGLAGGGALTLVLLGGGRQVSPVTAALACAAFAAAGVMARDRALTRSVERRRAEVRAEFPTVVDMVCIAVTAGESLRGALELVSGSGSGALAVELRVALRESRATPLADALARRATVIGLPAFDRFVSVVVAAQERGMSLRDALQAMAFDVREGEKRDVIEAAGRKQVSMLVPVVGLILPVAIVFAFYPGVIAIRTLAR